MKNQLENTVQFNIEEILGGESTEYIEFDISVLDKKHKKHKKRLKKPFRIFLYSIPVVLLAFFVLINSPVTSTAIFDKQVSQVAKEIGVEQNEVANALTDTNFASKVVHNNKKETSPEELQQTNLEDTLNTENKIEQSLQDTENTDTSKTVESDVTESEEVTEETAEETVHTITEKIKEAKLTIKQPHDKDTLSGDFSKKSNSTSDTEMIYEVVMGEHAFKLIINSDLESEVYTEIEDLYYQLDEKASGRNVHFQGDNIDTLSVFSWKDKNFIFNIEVEEPVEIQVAKYIIDSIVYE